MKCTNFRLLNSYANLSIYINICGIIKMNIFVSFNVFIYFKNLNSKFNKYIINMSRLHTP